MFVSDVIIGGEFGVIIKKIGNSWTRTNFDIDMYIAENIYTYKIHDVYLGVGLIIHKDSIEGNKFAKMLIGDNDAITDEKYIQEYLEELLIKNISVKSLKQAIDYKVKSSFFEGKPHKVEEFRKLLEIENY